MARAVPADPGLDPRAAQRIGGRERRALSHVGSRRAYPCGSILAFEGAPAREVLIVEQGSVKSLLSSTDGREVILDILERGSSIGELAAIDAGPLDASYVALGRVAVLAIPLAEFRRFLADHPAAHDALALRVTAKLRASVRRQLELGTGDAMQRLCRRLCELADRFGAPGPRGAVIFESPLNQSELGSWSGLSREAVVKAMRAMRRLGWIDNVGATITIVDLDEVRARAAYP